MKRIWFIIILLLFVTAGSAQIQVTNSPVIVADTMKMHLPVYDLSEIPVKSSELKIKVKQDISDLISEDEIRSFKLKSEDIHASLSHDQEFTVDPADNSVGVLRLENRQIKLQQEKRKIEEQKALLNEVIQNLDNFKDDLTQETVRWNEMLHSIVVDSINTVAPPVKLTETITFLDSSVVFVSKKSKSLLDILDHTIETGAEIDAQFDENKALIKSKQRGVLNRDHPPLIQTSFSANFAHEISISISNVLSIDFAVLSEYLGSNGNAILIMLLIFVAFVYLFILIKKNVIIDESGFGSFYKRMLLKVLSHPYSASAILTLFSTIFIFTDRPLVFRQISLYIIALPLIHILSLLLDKRYHNYIYALGAVILIYIFLIFLPSDLVIYRVFLLLISVGEISLLSMFLLRFDRKHELKERGKKMVYFFVFLHLGLAAVGFVSNLTGRVVLTEIVLSAVFYNIFNGLVLFVTVLLVNGLVVVGVDSKKGKQINIFRMHDELIKRKTIYLLNVFVSIFWVGLILKNFRVSESLYNGILSLFTYKISIGSASFSLDDFVIFFVVIYASIVLSKLIRIVLQEDVLNRLSLSKGLPNTIAMLVRYSLITAGFILAISAAGIPVDKLTIIIGAMSVGIGFGLQNIFNNLVSGLILLFERPIQLGDTVQVGQLTGNVQTIGLRSSNIKTFDGAEVIVPNGQLISNEVINWTLSDQKRRIEIIVGVTYNSDPPMVRDLLNQILVNHPDVLMEPLPAVFFNGFGESSLDFVLLFWIGDYNNGRRIKSEVLFSIFEMLKANNIEIPFPQRDLHLRSVDPEIVIRNKDGVN